MKEYRTLNKMNKPIRMMGLSSLQFLAIIVIVGLTITLLVSSGTSLFAVLVVLMVEITPIVFYTSKASMEHKKGNPTYFSSWWMFGSTPKKIIDRKGILNYIKR